MRGLFTFMLVDLHGKLHKTIPYMDAMGIRA